MSNSNFPEINIMTSSINSVVFHFTKFKEKHVCATTWTVIKMCMASANGRRRCNGTSSLIVWPHIQNNPCVKATCICDPESISLTHWGRVTHICVSKLTIIGSDNGLSPERRQANVWTNAGILLIETLGTNFSDILGEIHTFSLKEMNMKPSSAKRRPFCLGLNVSKSSFSAGDWTECMLWAPSQYKDRLISVWRFLC